MENTEKKMWTAPQIIDLDVENTYNGAERTLSDGTNSETAAFTVS